MQTKVTINNVIPVGDYFSYRFTTKLADFRGLRCNTFNTESKTSKKLLNSAVFPIHSLKLYISVINKHE